jgi:gliding motility-associated-like protein
MLSFDVPGVISVSYQEMVTIPSNEPAFRKTILGPYKDLFSKPIDPHNEFIYYLTIGNAPERKLIVGWCDAPMFSCENQRVTYQIVLSESDSSVTNHIIAKPPCDANFGNKATHGLNLNSDVAVAVPGRNNASWTEERETWIFKPDGLENYLISSSDFQPEVIVPEGKLTWSWYKNVYPSGEIVSTEQSFVVYPLESTTYFVEISCCGGLKYVDDIYVKVIPVPNAFNPDSPVEKNRIFRVYANPDEKVYNYKIMIYNRWGELVFETENVDEGWDGTSNGKECNAGVYAWAISYRGEGGEVTNKGVVTLVR